MFKRYIVAGCFITAAISTLFLSSVIDAQKNMPRPKAPGFPATAQPVRLVAFGVSGALRAFPAGDQAVNDAELRTEGHEINEKNTERVRPSIDGPSVDGSIQAQAARAKSNGSELGVKLPASANAPSTDAATPSTLLTFEGIPVQNSAPPDTNAAVGPSDVVETVNTLVQVFDKSGNPRGAAFKQSSLYKKIGGVCATTDDGDPVVLYDRLANRWIITQFGFTNSTVPPYHECIAVSKTGDPTGEYYAYDFQLPGNEFPDYPKFGVWPDGYYMTTNQFLNGGSFDGVGAFAFDRNKMLVGDPTAGGVYFDLDLASHPEGVFGMLPSDHAGLLPPPAGTPNVFIYFTNVQFGDPADGLRLFNLNFNTTNYIASTFLERSESTYATPLALTAFDARIPNGRAHVEQPPPAGNNSTDNLDSVGERMMYPLRYINRNGTESLIGNFTVNVSGVNPVSAATFQAGFRYFELQRTDPGNLYAVNQQSTVFINNSGISGASGVNAWMASVGMDNEGNIAAGFSVSDVSIFNPSLVYGGRAISDPPNNFSFANVLFPGPGVQRGTSNRWGDYSSLSLDPTDDCTFWHANEYYTSNNLTFNWQTRIGAFKISQTCQAPAQGTLSGIVTACDSGAPISLAMVTVSNGVSSTTIADGTYSIQLPPGDYTVTVTDPNRHCASAGAFNVTINDGQTTNLNACLNGIANPVVDPSDPTLEVVTGGNGNGIIDSNECNMLEVTAKNFGCAPARKVTAVLSTSTAGVTITQPSSAYPDMPVDASADNITPFKVSTSPAFVCGTPINFTLTINFTGGSTVNNFTLQTCTETKPPQLFSGSLAAGDTVQTGRTGRDGIVGSCGGKPCPAPFANATPHLYDKFSFVNGPAAACVTVNLTNNTSTATNPLLAKAYLTSYDPTNFCTNYLGDPGGSGTNTSFQATVPANATLVVVVEESGNGSTVPPFTAPTNYSGSVTGLSAAAPPGGGICKTTPILTTNASPSTHAGGTISDGATLSGLIGGTGTITFRLYGPNQANCGGAVVFSSTKTVTGNGNYFSDPYTVPANAPGTYRWIATYSGDAANSGVSGACNDANESVTVVPAGTTVMGQGTILVPGGCQATFDLNVFPGKRKPGGSLDYADPCAGFLLTQVRINSLSINADHATITGTAKIGNKTKVSFVVDVNDNAPPGIDTYTISLSNGYFGSGDLTSGNITIK